MRSAVASRTSFWWFGFCGAVLLVVIVGLAPSPALAKTTVVGGSVAPPGSWPEMAAIVVRGQSAYAGHLCGGTLIDPRWVLTAAHCTIDDGGGLIPGRMFDVVLGARDLGAVKVPGAQRIPVTRIVRHPRRSLNVLAYDVALLRLSRPATLSAVVQPLNLVASTSRTSWLGDQPAFVAGWGSTSRDARRPVAPRLLQQAQIAVGSDERCQARAGSDFRASSMTCAGGSLDGGVDTCYGDSGGPLTVEDLNGRRVLVGVTSFGTVPSCGFPNAPTIYARVGAPVIRDFIYGPKGVASVDPPSAPLTVAATRPTPDVVAVSWQRPARTGGRSIAGYRVSVLRAGVVVATMDVPAGARSYEFAALDPAVDSVAVQAAGPAGLSLTARAVIG